MNLVRSLRNRNKLQKKDKIDGNFSVNNRDLVYFLVNFWLTNLLTESTDKNIKKKKTK